MSASACAPGGCGKNGLILKRSGARRLKFDKDGGRSKLVKGRFEIDMDEFGVDKDVIRTSSTRSIRWRHQNLALATNLWNWVRVKDSKT